jgi:16S rRNA (guanine966-N2)-methyltransferase
MSNQLRIIGGRWRGRKFSFPDAPGLRPTPDRVRETLFNWLMHDIHDAMCLDAFAGSGAVGLEALSRGAKQVVFLEQNPKAADSIRSILKEMNIQAQVTTANTLQYLKQSSKQLFNLVFLDPPFHKSLIPETLELLSQGWLKPESLVYIECESSLKLEDLLPKGFSILKDKQAGEVRYGLILFQEI